MRNNYQYQVVSHNDGTGCSLDAKAFPARDKAEEYVKAEIQRLIDESHMAGNASLETFVDEGRAGFDGDDAFLELFGVTYEWGIIEQESEDPRYKDVLGKFQSYVSNDADAAEPDYVREALDCVGIDASNAEEYGLGWVFTEE